MHSRPARIALAYLTLGAVWVLASEWVLPGLGVPTGGGRALEGLAFVAASTAVVFFLVFREFGVDRATLEEREAVERRLAAAARFEAIGQLTGGIAHDFNNLITAIAGNLDSYLGRRNGRARSVELEEAKRSTDRAAELTRQLLAFGRRQDLHPERIDVNEVIRDMSSLLHRLIGDRIRITTACDQRLWTVHADPGRVEQVVMNLAINARDAMPDGGELVLRTSNAPIDEEQSRRFPFPFEPGEYVRLDVEDTGVGMDADTQTHIFEPFFTTKPEGEGTGLGLATVYGIVKQSGGYIDVCSVPGDGATFSIFLPRVAERAEAAPAVGAPVEAEGAGSETVLVVEDDAAVRSVVMRVLERRGFAVLEAPDGPEALDVLQHIHGGIDLLIADAVMPEMPGCQLIETARSRYPGLRALLISGYMADDLGSTAPYLAKPFTPSQLVRSVRAALDH